MGTLTNYWDIDHLIVYAFLLLILFIGLYVGGSSKDLRDYAIAGRGYKTSALLLTFLATAIGGGTTLGIAQKVYSDGPIMLLASSGYIIPYLFMARFVAPRMAQFEGSITIGDVMDKLYGRYSKVTTGIVGFLLSIFIVASQTLALGYLSEVLLGIEKPLAIVAEGVIVMLYAAFGGIRSITVTEVVQFGIIIVVIPLIASIAIDKAGGLASLFAKLPAEKVLILSHPRCKDYLVLFLVWSGVFPIFPLTPPVIQRMLMAKNSQQIARMFWLGTAFTPAFEIIITLIGLAAWVLYPSINPGDALPHIINELLPSGLKGLAVAGMSAVIMSTADSSLNAAALLLSHDITEPLCDKMRVPINRLRATKYFTLLIGSVATLLAYYSDDIIKLLFYGFGLFGSLISTPLLSGILGLKTDATSFFFALFSTLLTLITLVISGSAIHQYLILPFSIAVNIVSFFAAHIIQNRGIALVKLEGNTSAAFSWSLDWERIKQPILHCLPTLSNIYNYSKRRIEKYGASHVLFGTFCCMNYIVTYFMWTTHKASYHATILIMRIIAGTLCVGLLLRDQWPDYLKRYFPSYWHLTLLYTLPFLTTVMFLLNSRSIEWFANIAMAIMLLVLLVDWLSFVLLSILGGFLGIGFYSLMVGPLTMDLRTLYVLLYTFLFAALIGFLFARKREQEAAKQLQRSRLLGGAIGHEVSNAIGTMDMLASVLQTSFKMNRIDRYTDARGETRYEIDKGLYNLLSGLPQELKKQSTQAHQTIDMLLTAVKTDLVATASTVFSISEGVREAVNEYHFSEGQRAKVSIEIKENFDIRFSRHYFRHVLSNLLSNAYRHGGQDISITITADNHCLTFRDNGQGIANKDLPHIFDYFYTTSKAGAGIGLGFCKLVMNTFDSQISCHAQQGADAYTAFVLAFPPGKKH